MPALFGRSGMRMRWWGRAILENFRSFAFPPSCPLLAATFPSFVLTRSSSFHPIKPFLSRHTLRIINHSLYHHLTQPEHIYLCRSTPPRETLRTDHYLRIYYFQHEQWKERHRGRKNQPKLRILYTPRKSRLMPCGDKSGSVLKHISPY